MSTPTQFLLEQTPLPPGRCLLEANAGTGKTYAIAGIAARLVAEHDLPLRSLLIVTFTEAATRELRDRVRRRLAEVAAEVLREEPADPAARAIRRAVDPERARHRLLAAVAAFDEAAIFTIHGFCQRLLTDHAFASGVPFAAEVLPDPRELLLDVAMDFWRRHVFAGPALAGALARLGRHNPASLRHLLGRLQRHPDLVVLPAAPMPLAAATQDAENAWRNAISAWATGRHEALELIRESKALSRSVASGLREDLLQAHDDALARALTDGWPDEDALAAMTVFSATHLANSLKRSAKAPAPVHPCFDAADAFVSRAETWHRALLHEWIRYAAAELPCTKRARGVMTFDDMLTEVRAALRSPGGAELAAAVGREFSAALIDEFQDTDPLQWEIFERCFSGPEHRLFLIGDPKQSIYAFRGADLFTYLRARREVAAAPTGGLFTLLTNHRSAPALVGAVNALFQRVPDPFLQADLTFAPSGSNDRAAREQPLQTPPDETAAPLRLVVAGEVDPESTEPGGADAALHRHVATEIARLIAGGHRLGERPLGPGDIAVLVRKHHQAVALERVLRRARIPCVRHTEESVFETREAGELAAVLGSWLDPRREQALRAALATRLGGVDAAGLIALQEDETAWQERVDQCLRWRGLWEQHGFIRAFRQYLVDEDIRARLVGEESGERLLTNVLHLAELLHQAERDLRLSPAGLWQWLQHQRASGEAQPEAHFLRLDRDDDAVQIVTLHKAKGLQYPVTFCPFHWSPPQTKLRAQKEGLLFHDPDAGDGLTLDLSSPIDPVHLAAAERENLAEDVRLLYVGVTRAVHRCYLYWRGTKGSPGSALGHVLGLASGDEGEAGIAACRDLAAASGGTISVEDLDEKPLPPVTQPTRDEATLEARPPPAVIDRTGLVASFTALTASREEDPRDRDAVAAAPGATGAEPTIFSLPRGAATGNALHGVLEELDFTRPGDLPALVQRHLAAAGIDPAFAPVLVTQLSQLLEQPLPVDGEPLRLGTIAPRDRASEVEFFFPLRRLTPEELAAAWPAGFPDLGPGRLHFNPVEGYVLGFIDLILRRGDRYYVVDWKSNWLGDTTADYAPPRLDEAMREARYHLQAHLYAVALDRHLAARLRDYDYERHFGGLIYLFVRGLDPDHPDRGVHFQRPPRAALQAFAGRLLAEPDPAP